MMFNSEDLLLSRRVLLSNYLSFSSYFVMLLKSPRIPSEPADTKNMVNLKKICASITGADQTSPFSSPEPLGLICN